MHVVEVVVGEGRSGDAESWLSLQVAHDLRLAEISTAARIQKEIDPRAA